MSETGKETIDLNDEMTNPAQLVCAKRRLGSAWANAKTDQSLFVALRR